jgi:hypothetical protein
MTSAPYTMKKGVYPMAQLVDAQLPHSAHGSSSIHFLPCYYWSNPLWFFCGEGIYPLGC